MTLSENLRSSPSALSIFISRIISYIPLVDLSMWHFHVTIFVALNSSRQKSTLTFFQVVNLPDRVCHIVSDDYFYLIFGISLPIKIVELILLSDIIRKLLNSDLPLRVFMQPCRIGE